MWIERAVFISILAVVAGWLYTSRLSSGPTSIVIDGKPVVTVESKVMAEAVLDRVRSAKTEGLPDSEIRLTEPVRLKKASSKAGMAEMPEAVSALESRVGVEAALTCIVVDGKPVVALGQEKAASETLELLKKHYQQELETRAESEFKESVYIDKLFVDPGIYRRTSEEAVRVLTTPTEDPTYHTVERGDRAAKIVPKYDISLAELKKLNPEVNVEQITEGDRLLIRLPGMPVTVITRAVRTKTVTVTPPPGAGRTGRVGTREMKIEVTYHNGQPVRERIVSQITRWETSTQRSPSTYSR